MKGPRGNEEGGMALEVSGGLTEVVEGMIGEWIENAERNRRCSR